MVNARNNVAQRKQLEKPVLVRVRPSTRDKLIRLAGAIQASTGQEVSVGEAVARAVDFYIEKKHPEQV